MDSREETNEAMRQQVREAGIIPPPYHVANSKWDGSIWAFEEGIGAKVLDMRGWGFLTGTCALNLPEEEAAKIQDATKAFIVKACNHHKPLINALEIAVRRLYNGSAWADDSEEFQEILTVLAKAKGEMK